MRKLAFALVLLFATPALAQPEPEWSESHYFGVRLELNEYIPHVIRLQAGQPVRMEFVNNTNATLSISAGAFFRSAQIRSGDGDIVRHGGFRLRPGENVAIELVPHEGRYRMRSQSLYRRLIGASARIIVEAPAGT